MKYIVTENNINKYKKYVRENKTNNEIMKLMDISIGNLTKIREQAIKDREFSKELIKRNSLNCGKAFKKSIPEFNDTIAYKRVKLMIKNNMSIKEGAEYFNIKIGAINTNIIQTIKNNNYGLYTIYKRLQKKKSMYNPFNYNLALSTLLGLRHGKEISRVEFKEQNNLTEKQMRCFENWLKILHPYAYKKIKIMFQKNRGNNCMYIKIAKYLIEHKCSYKQAGEYFGLSHKTIRVHMDFSLKRNNPEMYELVKNRKYI